MSVSVPPHVDDGDVRAVQRVAGDVEARAYVHRLSVLQTTLGEFSTHLHPTLVRARERVASDAESCTTTKVDSEQ